MGIGKIMLGGGGGGGGTLRRTNILPRGVEIFHRNWDKPRQYAPLGSARDFVNLISSDGVCNL